MNQSDLPFRPASMTEQNRDPGGLPPAEHFRLVGEISCLVSRISASELPTVINRILQGMRRITGLKHGAISLLDYVNDRCYTADADDNMRSFHVGDSSTPPLDWRQSPFIAPGRSSGRPISFPLSVGSQQIGSVILASYDEDMILSESQEELLVGLSSLAALAIERFRSELDRFRLQEWMDSANRVTRSGHDVELLVQAIADNALKISQADFVTLYEYFEERDDVRIPPTMSGIIFDPAVLSGRGVAVEHKRSVIFRLLERRTPFYAERAPDVWISEGLIGSEALIEERSFFQREKIVASAGIPLRIDAERVGLLFLNYRRERTFGREFREQLELFANQAALALGHARFLLRSERYSRILEVLNEIGRELGSVVSRDIEQIGRLIHEQTGRVIKTQNLFLCLYNERLGTFELPYISDEHNTREILMPGLREGLTGYVCRTGEPQLITAEKQHILIASGKAQPVGWPSAIWLGAPLIVRDEVIGVLVVQDYANETAFTEEHLQLLTAIASQAAIAIDNYRLLRDAQLRLEELSALLSLSQAFGTGQLTSAQFLSSMLDHICKLVSCHGSLLLLTAPGTSGDLKIAAASHSMKRYAYHLSRGEGVSSRVVETKTPIVQNDYGEWSKRSSLFDPAPKHVCGVPLVWNAAVIGVLLISSDFRDKPFGPREMEILQRFAGPAAAAVQNARNSAFQEALIHNGPNAIVAADLDGRITELSAEAARLFKYNKKDILGKHVSKLFWDRRRFRTIQETLARQSKIEEEEVFGRSRNGEKIPLSLTAVLLKEGNEQVMGYLGVVDDLRIQALRSRTSLLLDALGEISAQESLAEIIRSVVDSSVSLLYADSACLFLKETEVFQLKFALGVDADLLVALEAGLAQDRLSSFAADDPKTILFLEEAGIEDLRLMADARSCVLAPIRTDTRLLAFLLIESRATSHFGADQKLLEVLVSQAAVSISRVQLLRDRERTERGLLVSANAIAVGQIAATFLHEAKNSLNGINLTVQSLREDITRETDLKSKRDYIDRLEAIQLEVARFDMLSRRLQRFTQQGLSPQKKETYLNPIVSQTLVLLGSAIRSKNLKQDIRLDPSLDSPAAEVKGKSNAILVDEDQIQQVLMNLILNAVAASGERRPLLIETKNFGYEVEVRVTDHGTGIPNEVRGRLFKPFFTTKRDGVGLGLFLSRLLIEENHGGSIEIVSSAPGKGSVFAVRLPKRYDRRSL